MKKIATQMISEKFNKSVNIMLTSFTIFIASFPLRNVDQTDQCSYLDLNMDNKLKIYYHVDSTRVYNFGQY